jgi:hypothetical protein
LHEFRIRHDEDEIHQMFGGREARIRPKERILLRVFVHFHGSKVVLLFGGYDKGRDPGSGKQDQEVKKAQRMLKDWRVRERAKEKS